MIDTHAHLDACADGPEDVVRRAREAGVTRVLTVGTGIESCRVALELAGRHDGVHAILGVHPHEAAGPDARRLDQLAALLGDPLAVAVGETGLDFFRDYAPRDRQRELFEAQLELASRLGKPVVVHSRAAEDETAAALARFAGTVVLHCFSSPGLLDVALERRYYVSFAGNVTYPNAYDLRAAARGVPPDRILAETDAPYLSPQPVRGRRNEPANVVHTVAALAAARNETVDELARRIDENAGAAFGLPG